jgi:hypothetical protein
MFILYEIRNVASDMAYFGQVEPHSNPYRKRKRTVKDRWNEHKKKLRRRTHTNSYLQNAWNKYGESSFRFSIIEEGVQTQVTINELEDDYIKNNECYNLKSGGRHCTFDNKTIEKIRRASKRLWRDTKYRNAVSKGLRESWTEERRSSMGYKMAKRFGYILLDPQGVKYNNIHNLRAFCRAHRLSRTCVLRLVSGEQKQHKGWRIRNEPKTNAVGVGNRLERCQKKKKICTT